MADEWIECALAHACSSIDYGLTASASDQEVGPRFLRITDIVSGHIDWNAVPHVVADAETAEKYRLHDGDVVLARTGASTGSSAYVKNPPPAVFASYLVRLKANPDFDSRFLAYYLKSEGFLTFIRGVLGDKSAQPNASASTMTKAPLRAPGDKNEQRAIAHILGTLDDKIELNRRMSETLEAMARALFKSWFVDFDPVRAKMEGRDPGLPQPLADLFPARLVDSELGEIPEGWLTAALADAIEIVDGRTLSSSMRDDGGRFRAFGANGPIAQSKEAWVDSPCIILGKIGTCGALHRSPAPCWVTNNAFAVLAGRSRSLEFAWHILKVIDFSNYVGGSANPYMPLKNFGHHLIVLPPPEVLEPFQLLAGSLRSRVEAAETQSRTLAALRDALLPKLISGELRVPDAEAFLKARDP